MAVPFRFLCVRVEACKECRCTRYHCSAILPDSHIGLVANAFSARTLTLRRLIGRQVKKPERITLTKIEGRTWLVDSKNRPFFAHGITRFNNNKANIDLNKISELAKGLGFNAYGYGCPA